MTDCCLSPRPEGLTAHTARCLLAPTPVAQLRALVRRDTEPETDQPEEGNDE